MKELLHTAGTQQLCSIQWAKGGEGIVAVLFVYVALFFNLFWKGLKSDLSHMAFQ